MARLPGGLIIYQGHLFTLKGHLWEYPQTFWEVVLRMAGGRRGRGGGSRQGRAAEATLPIAPDVTSFGVFICTTGNSFVARVLAWVWRPQVLVYFSICQGSMLGTYFLTHSHMYICVCTLFTLGFQQEHCNCFGGPRVLSLDAHTHTHIYIYMYIHTHTRINTYIYICIHIYKNATTYIDVYVYICIYIYMIS